MDLQCVFPDHLETIFLFNCVGINKSWSSFTSCYCDCTWPQSLVFHICRFREKNTWNCIFAIYQEMAVEIKSYKSTFPFHLLFESERGKQESLFWSLVLWCNTCKVLFKAYRLFQRMFALLMMHNSMHVLISFSCVDDWLVYLLFFYGSTWYYAFATFILDATWYVRVINVSHLKICKRVEI